MAKNLKYLDSFLNAQQKISNPNEMQYFGDKGFVMWLISIPQPIKKDGEAFLNTFKQFPLRLDSYAFGFFEDSDRKSNHYRFCT